MRVLLALFLVVSAVASAHAEEPADHARALFQKGQTEFALGNFLEAAHQFEAAYREAQRPALLFNIAQSYRNQYEIDHDPAHLRRARAVYHSFADLAVDEHERADAKTQEQAMDTELRAAEQRIAAQKALPVDKLPVDKLPVEPPHGAVAPPPAATVPPVSPGPSIVELHTPQKPPTVVPELVTPAATPPAAPASRRWWLWTAVGAVVVGVAVVAVVAFTTPSDATQPASLGGNYMPKF